MKIELISDLCSCEFEVKDKEAESFIDSHLEAGKEFDVFFIEENGGLKWK